MYIVQSHFDNSQIVEKYYFTPYFFYPQKFFYVPILLFEKSKKIFVQWIFDLVTVLQLISFSFGK